MSVEPRVWYNPELRSALFLVPGLIAYIGMISAVISTALSVVREKERGTMEQVRMAPLGTFSYIVGKTHAVLRHFDVLVAGDHAGVDGAVRLADERIVAAAVVSLSLYLPARSVSA